MCRSCGAIVGAGQPQCAVCGAPTSGQPAPAGNLRPPDRETIRFARAVLSRPYKFTIIFLVANLFVYLLMWESSGMTSTVLWTRFPDSVLITYGAKLNYLVNAPHYQWWRLIAPMFVHINLIHLLVNMYSLMMVGPFVEKLYGGAKFVVFWVVTGIFGVVASYLTVRPQLATNPFTRFIFKAEDVPSAGASGALFGLVGVLFIFGIKFRHELPEGFKRTFGTGMLPIILLNLFIGFIGSGFIDNAAHLGGLLSGAALALAFDYRRPGVRPTITVMLRVLQILALSTVVLAFYKVARNFNRPVPPSARMLANAHALIFLNYLNAMNQVQEKVSVVIHKNDRSNIELITQRAMEAPAPDQEAVELRNRLLVILSRLAEAADADQKLVDEFKEWRKAYDAWLKTAAQKYTGAH